MHRRPFVEDGVGFFFVSCHGGNSNHFECKLDVDHPRGSRWWRVINALHVIIDISHPLPKAPRARGSWPLCQICLRILCYLRRLLWQSEPCGSTGLKPTRETAFEIGCASTFVKRSPGNIPSLH